MAGLLAKLVDIKAAEFSSKSSQCVHVFFVCVYIDAGFRHFAAYAGGEKNDSETGLSHLAHAMCCMLFLLSFDLGEDK
jgi:hypothetical protein